MEKYLINAMLLYILIIIILSKTRLITMLKNEKLFILLGIIISVIIFFTCHYLFLLNQLK